jgi:hypothetical protein
LDASIFAEIMQKRFSFRKTAGAVWWSNDATILILMGRTGIIHGGDGNRHARIRKNNRICPEEHGLGKSGVASLAYEGLYRLKLAQLVAYFPGPCVQNALAWFLTFLEKESPYS